MKKILISIILVIFTTLIFANDLILDIEIEGNNKIESRMIRSVITFDTGEFLSEEKVAESIKNLYQLNVFSDVKIYKETRDNGLIVKIIVKEFPIVNELEIEGNDKLNEKEIKELITISKGSYFAPYLKSEARRNIIEKYREKSYNYASVDFEVEKLQSDLVNVTIKIDEGEKIVIKKIEIHGNKKVTDKDILGEMKTKKSSLFRSGKFEKQKFEEDLNRIINYYNEEGFIDARIISHESEIKDEKYMYIDIYVFEGEKYYFGKIKVEGNKKYTDQTIQEIFQLREGDIFDNEKFGEEIKELYSLYYNEGYLYVNVNKDLEKKGNKININLTINEGNRAKVRKIIITGNRKTKEKVIRRHLAIHPGDYFRQSKIVRTQRNIYNLGFFEPDIGLEFPPINSKGDVDVRINVVDKISGTANAGIGYNSQDKVVGTLSLSHKNLFGNAWSTSVNWEFGASTQDIDFSFTNPYMFDTNTLGGIRLYHTRREWTSFDYETQNNGGALKFGRPIYLVNFSKFISEYSYYAKKYEITDFSENVSDNLAELDSLGWQYTSSFSLSLIRDSRDNVYFASSGSKFSLYSELAGGPLGGDFDYFKQIMEVNWYTKTFWKFALKTKWRFGYVTSYGDTKEVPPDERFTLGGTGPDGIRGYADSSIGPGDDPSSIGGLKEILFSMEYGVPLAGDQIITILFFDAGDCFNEIENFNFMDLKKGGGLGLRVRSPLGIIGFDYGYNFDEKKWEPHFQFGTTF